MKFSNLLIISILLCTGSPLYAESLADSDRHVEEAIHIGNNLSVASQSQNENNPQLNAAIQTTYPQIIGNSLSPSANNFNAAVQTMVNNEIARFKTYCNQDLAHMKSLAPEMQANSLTVDYDIDVIHPNGGTLISVRLNTEGLQAGRAHPYHTRQVLNFDLTQNKVLSLADLFKSKADYLKVLAAYSQKALKTKIQDNWANKGAASDPKNFQTWNVENDMLVITFGEYQVAPYAYGMQEVEIPYKELKTILSPTAAIYSCAENPNNCEKVQA